MEVDEENIAFKNPEVSLFIFVFLQTSWWFGCDFATLHPCDQPLGSLAQSHVPLLVLVAVHPRHHLKRTPATVSQFLSQRLQELIDVPNRCGRDESFVFVSPFPLHLLIIDGPSWLGTYSAAKNRCLPRMSNWWNLVSPKMQVEKGPMIVFPTWLISSKYSHLFFKTSMIRSLQSICRKSHVRRSC